MEPFITGSLTAASNVDLTPSLLQDIGWQLETLTIGSCDTGVPNALPNGDILSVPIQACAADARNKGQFVSCVNRVTNGARKAGLLSGRDKSRITTGAAAQ